MLLVRVIAVGLIGVVQWYAFYKRQQEPEESGRYVFKAPEWLAFACGRPLPDDRLELGNTIAQIIVIIGMPPAIPIMITRFSHPWILLMVFALLGPMTAAILTDVIIRIVRRAR